MIQGASPQELADLAIKMSPLADRSSGLYEELNDAGAEMFAVAAAIGDPVVASAMFAGKDRTPLIEDQRRSFAEVFDEKVGDVFTFEGSTADNRELNLQASIAVYQAIRDDQLEFDEKAFEKALTMVTGGIGERDGFKVELPRGVEQGAFNQAFDVVDAEMLKELAPEGFAGMTYEQAAIRIGQSRIRSTNNNEYTPIFKTTDQNMFMLRNGQPFIFQWNDRFVELSEEARKRDAGRMEVDPLDVDLTVRARDKRPGGF